MTGSAKFIVIGVIAVVIIACGVFAYYQYYHNQNNPAPLQSNINITAQPGYHYSGTNATIVANSVNSFALRIFSRLSNSTGNQSNLFFSPFSVATALAMTSEGAGGNTLQGMYTALNLSNDSSADRLGFQSLLGGLSSNGGVELSIADSVWVEKSFPISSEFLGNVARYYAATAYPADFVDNPNGEATTINNWISNRTDSKITNVIPPDAITALTRLVLVDAIYFKGNWAQQFKKADTYNQPFHVSSDENVTVPMMHLETRNVSYYQNQELQALGMNYVGDNVSMIILLPNASHSLSDIEKNLSVSELSGIRDYMYPQLVQISMPKFNMTWSSDLSTPLEALGMGSAFDQNSANFSRMYQNFSAASDQRLYISAVLHKAFISVDEQGTTAAAATVVGLTAGAVLNENPQPIVFDANHPFVFLIVDDNTGAILFMGTETNPTMSS